jgi:HK97 family phage portal protein
MLKYDKNHIIFKPMLNFFKNFFTTRTKSNYLDNFYFANDVSGPKVGVESYKTNVIVNRCVNIIAQSASHVPWLVMKKTPKGFERAVSHYANKLLKRPSPSKAGAEFFSEIVANKLLFGNSYILAINQGNRDQAPYELYSLNPAAVEVVSNLGVISGYKYSVKTSNKSHEKIYTIDAITKQSQVLHIKNYNPTNSIYGLSCIESAGSLIDLHNRATQWNHTLLKNGARPSGALVVSNGGNLTQEQFDRLKCELQEKYYGSNNAGKPMLLEGGLDWKEMSISPKDMDFIESKNSAAREIALAFGVPPQLLGINGDNTYSNMQEARLALWEETLIPLLDKIADGLSNWLSYWFKDDLVIDFDRDAISILTERRQKLMSTLNDIKFMSTNEKRAIVGLPATQSGNDINTSS